MEKRDSIALWKVAPEKRTERSPVLRGNVEIDGVKYKVSLWPKRADAHPNAPDLRGQIELEQEQPKPAPAPAPKQADTFIDDDVPW